MTLTLELSMAGFNTANGLYGLKSHSGDKRTNAFLVFDRKTLERYGIDPRYAAIRAANFSGRRDDYTPVASRHVMTVTLTPKEMPVEKSGMLTRIPEQDEMIFDLYTTHTESCRLNRTPIGMSGWIELEKHADYGVRAESPSPYVAPHYNLDFHITAQEYSVLSALPHDRTVLKASFKLRKKE